MTENSQPNSQNTPSGSQTYPNPQIYNPTIVINNSATANANGSGSFPVKSKIITLIVCILFGWGGFHRFYTGHVIVGLLYMFSFGMLGIGWALDTLWILLGSFKDANGQLLK